MSANGSRIRVRNGKLSTLKAGAGIEVIPLLQLRHRSRTYYLGQGIRPVMLCASTSWPTILTESAQRGAMVTGHSTNPSSFADSLADSPTALRQRVSE